VPRSAHLEVVLIAYHFPPLAGMASNRAARLVNDLVERDHRVTVVTGSGDPPLEGPCVDIHRDVKVVRAGRRQLSGGVRAMRSRLPTAVGGVDGDGSHEPRQQRLRRWVRDWVYVPDAQIAWFPAAYRTARAELERLDDPVLWTTSVPYTCHLVGAALQRRTAVRWAAEFRDPWARAQLASVRSPRRLAVDRLLERKIVTRPDRLIFTTPETAELFANDHGSWVLDRTSVVPNAWRRSEAVAPDPPKPDAPLRLAYAGSLNDVQDARPLVEAIERVADTHGTVELHVAGSRQGWPQSSSLVLHGPIAPTDVPTFLSKASAVVLLAPGVHYQALLLGKTMDWLGSGQPCLAIVDPHGTMAGLVEESKGGIVCPTNDAEDIAEAIRQLLVAHRAGALPLLRPNPLIANRFEQASTTQRLIDALLETGTVR
jgi:glycosyltransferase involved in cell wall biosynthesis